MLTHFRIHAKLGIDVEDELVTGIVILAHDLPDDLYGFFRSAHSPQYLNLAQIVAGLIILPVLYYLNGPVDVFQSLVQLVSHRIDIAEAEITVQCIRFMALQNEEVFFSLFQFIEIHVTHAGIEVSAVVTVLLQCLEIPLQ